MARFDRMRFILPGLVIAVALGGFVARAKEPATLDQKRMASCEHYADAKKLAGAKRRNFVRHCAARLRSCNETADDQRLYSVQRDEFIEQCLNGK